MNITIALLIYKSPKYLDFVMNSLLEHPSKNHNIRYLIVCNDATDEVIVKASEYASILTKNYEPRIDVINHRNVPKDSFWIQNVYCAWNRCLAECETEAICFVNSDMAFTNEWLDSLATLDLTKYIPTSRLVESGRMPSIQGLISKNFGQTLASFDKNSFEKFAADVSKIDIMPNGAYMPSLFNTERLRAAGGWQKNRGNWPGDKITFAILKQKFGMDHLMVCDSIVYHFQRGESIECGDA